MQGTQVRHSNTNDIHVYFFLPLWQHFGKNWFLCTFSFRFLSVFPFSVCLFPRFDRFDSISMAMHMVTTISISIKELAKNMTIFKLEHGRNRKPPIFTASSLVFFYFPFRCSFFSFSRKYLTNISISDRFLIAVWTQLGWICATKRCAGRMMISQSRFARNRAQPAMCTTIKINAVGRVSSVAKNLNLWKMTRASRANRAMRQTNAKMAVINCKLK